ncbi:hypothetical protein RSAG8_10494, partial [Rhizoctonia solani AG-8 WAC10335]
MNGLNVPHLLLVGGFADNGYVRNEFKKHYEPRGSKVVLSDDSSSKAVATGAVIWGASCNVVSRVPRYSFGIVQSLLYRPLVDSPAGRKPYYRLSGDVRVDGGWSEIVHKGKAIDIGHIERRQYHRLYSTPTLKSNLFQEDLLAYSGDDEPEWAKDPHGSNLDGFRNVCTISANLKDAQGAMVMLMNRFGSNYWGLDFWVCIRFGGTELECFLEWKENGIERTGPASIILPHEASWN